MSPSKSCEINGPRPSPLMINNNSQTIRKPQLRRPVIIYTHSPKIIHTQPKDFMALVQRLTGLTSSGAGVRTIWPENDVSNENDSSSVLTEDNSGDVGARPSYGTPVMKKVYGNTDLFLSPGPVLRYFDDVSPSFGNSLSPSFVEFLKGFPEL